MRERRKLPQPCPGRSPGSKRILEHFLAPPFGGMPLYHCSPLSWYYLENGVPPPAKKCAGNGVPPRSPWTTPVHVSLLCGRWRSLTSVYREPWVLTVTATRPLVVEGGRSSGQSQTLCVHIYWRTVQFGGVLAALKFRDFAPEIILVF